MVVHLVFSSVVCACRLYCLFFFSYFALLLFTSFFFFFKQKTAYEMRISDWSSDVCSSDLTAAGARLIDPDHHFQGTVLPIVLDVRRTGRRAQNGFDLLGDSLQDVGVLADHPQLDESRLGAAQPKFLDLAGDSREVIEKMADRKSTRLNSSH